MRYCWWTRPMLGRGRSTKVCSKAPPDDYGSLTLQLYNVNYKNSKYWSNSLNIINGFFLLDSRRWRLPSWNQSSLSHYPRVIKLDISMQIDTNWALCTCQCTGLHSPTTLCSYLYTSHNCVYGNFNQCTGDEFQIIESRNLSNVQFQGAVMYYAFALSSRCQDNVGYNIASRFVAAFHCHRSRLQL